MKVYKFKLGDYPDLLHTMAQDEFQAKVSICEEYSVSVEDIAYFAEVERLSGRKTVKE
jgi:hypothetical protein